MEYYQRENFQQQQEMYPDENLSEADMQEYMQQMKAIQKIKELIKSEYLKTGNKLQGSMSPKPAGIKLRPAPRRVQMPAPRAASAIDACTVDELLEISEELSRSGHDVRGALEQAIETIENKQEMELALAEQQYLRICSNIRHRRGRQLEAAMKLRQDAAEKEKLKAALIARQKDVLLRCFSSNQLLEQQLKTSTSTHLPTVSDEYPINTTFNRVEHNQSPYKVDAVNCLADPRKVSDKRPGLLTKKAYFDANLQAPNSARVWASGRGIEKKGFLVTGEKAEFVVNAEEAGDGNLETVCIGPKGRNEKVEIKDNGDGTYSCAYMPYKAGDYVIALKYGGHYTGESPYRVHVTKPNKDAGDLLGDGDMLETFCMDKTGQDTHDTSSMDQTRQGTHDSFPEKINNIEDENNAVEEVGEKLEEEEGAACSSSRGSSPMLLEVDEGDGTKSGRSSLVSYLNDFCTDDDENHGREENAEHVNTKEEEREKERARVSCSEKSSKLSVFHENECDSEKEDDEIQSFKASSSHDSFWDD